MARGGVLPAALAIVVALALSGCGGGDDSSDTTATGTGTSATESRDGSSAGSADSEEDGEGEAGGQGSQANGDSSGTRKGPGVPQPKGEREPGITPEQREKATTANLTLVSPVFKPGKPIAAKYTCDGKEVSPPLRWKGLPPKTAELALFVMNLRPVNGRLFFDWAVAGLDPSSSSIEEGKLPPGAVVGENSFGKRDYSLCPPEEGKPENYVFALFAIPKALSAKPGFDPRDLRSEVLAQHGNAGLLGVTYERN